MKGGVRAMTSIELVHWDRNAAYGEAKARK